MKNCRNQKGQKNKRRLWNNRLNIFFSTYCKNMSCPSQVILDIRLFSIG